MDRNESKAFGKWLMNARWQRHVTMAQLSRISSVPVGEIMRIEGGMGLAVGPTAEKLCQALGVEWRKQHEE